MWISVHEEAIRGHKLRSLAKEIGCSQNEALGILVRLWLWGIDNADRTGKIVSADIEDVAEVMTVGCSRDFDPNEVVEALVSTGWMDSEEDGLYIHDWEDWQGQWYTMVETREKNKERKRRQRMSKRTVQEPVEKAPEQPKIETKKKYAESFEKWWEMYPRKIGKGEAYKKYCTRVKDGWSEEDLYLACKAYAEECSKRHTEMQYVKHPKTFLSDSTPFTDYIRKAPPADGNPEDPFMKWRS